MPELNGYEVLERLKADPALRDIPVIVLSASDESERVVRCIEMGAEDYLPKPFDPVLLQARIGASLEKKRLRDQEVSYLRQIQEEKQRSEDLLHIILPRDVAAELTATNAVKPRRFENVGVLFCDIVAFTAYCDRHSPEEIHAHLQALVVAFEKIVIEHGLEKIKTIGDSFMATAGLLTAAENPALNCVRCGLAMIAQAQALPPHWQIRVGVHAGPVIAGVVGRRKYQYDIWGDTVNTAARMMTAAAADTICVAADTWFSVAGDCEGSPQGRAEIKGKGEMELYRIERMRTP
jgi:class 3 adenylate cyclase